MGETETPDDGTDIEEPDLILTIGEGLGKEDRPTGNVNIDGVSGDKLYEAVEPRLAHLSKRHAKITKRMTRRCDNSAYFLHDFRPASVPVKHLFQLTDKHPIYSRSRQLAPAKTKLVREEIESMLVVGIIMPASTA